MAEAAGFQTVKVSETSGSSIREVGAKSEHMRSPEVLKVKPRSQLVPMVGTFNQMRKWSLMGP